MILNFCSIVEGHGEVDSLPILLRRIQQLTHPHLALNILRPIRIPRQRAVKPSELYRALELAVRQSKSPRVILILLDADDDLPCILGPNLLELAKERFPQVPLGSVLAAREFEAWFLAAIPSLRGHCGLPQNLPPLENAESVRSPKDVLTKLMQGPRAYSPVPDQATLARLFDLESARKSSLSFDKCWREVNRLLTEGKRLTTSCCSF